MLSGRFLIHLYQRVYRPLGKLFMLLLVGGLLPVPLQAATDIPGSSDPAEFSRYPLSHIVGYQQHSVPEYWLALGPMKKIDGVISPEKSIAIDGLLSRITYRIPDGHRSRDGFEHFMRQLQELGYTELYRCAGRRCGSSNQWANSQFGNAQLYGVDREQFYASMRSSDNRVTVALYAVKRGNKRIYLHLDLIRSSADGNGKGEAGSALAQQLRAGERVYVRLGDPLESLAEGLKGIAARNAALRVRLVGHSDRGANTAGRLASSRVDAERVRDRLVVLGVSEALLEVHGIGDLAPVFDGSIPKIRVELVLE